MTFTQRISDKKRALTYFLFNEKKYSCRKIALKTKISKSSVSRVIREEDDRRKGRRINCKKLGRACLLSDRDQRQLSCSITELRLTDANFTAMDVVKNSGVSCTKAKYRTFVSYLHKLGYKFRQTRKKGLLSESDYKRRLKYARKMPKRDQTY